MKQVWGPSLPFLMKSVRYLSASHYLAVALRHIRQMGSKRERASIYLIIWILYDQPGINAADRLQISARN